MTQRAGEFPAPGDDVPGAPPALEGDAAGTPEPARGAHGGQQAVPARPAEPIPAGRMPVPKHGPGAGPIPTRAARTAPRHRLLRPVATALVTTSVAALVAVALRCRHRLRRADADAPAVGYPHTI